MTQEPSQKGNMAQPDIAGDWQGLFGEKKLSLVIRLSASGADAWKATMYSIDQSSLPIPIDAAVQEGRSLKLTVYAIRSTIEGTLSPDGNRLPHARHDVFSSNGNEVLWEMNDFIAKLP